LFTLINIFFLSVDSTREIPDFLPEVGEHSADTVVPLLGRVVDTEKRAITLSPFFKLKVDRVRSKLEAEGAWSVQEALQAWGLVFFGVEILHLPLCDFRDALDSLAKICRLFVAEKLELDDLVPDWEYVRQRLLHLFKTIDWDGAALIPETNCAPHLSSCVVFSDASSEGGGFVFLSHDKIVIDSFALADLGSFSHINEKEAAAAWYAMSTIEPYCRSVTWCTDSKVVYFAVKKGRSKNRVINEYISKILALQCWVKIKWIRSGENVADAPSRGRHVLIDNDQNARLRQQFAGDPSDLLRLSCMWRPQA
jgi:hypothetical protein